jgi:hypothetical protein
MVFARQWWHAMVISASREAGRGGSWSKVSKGRVSWRNQREAKDWGRGWWGTVLASTRLNSIPSTSHRQDRKQHVAVLRHESAIWNHVDLLMGSLVLSQPSLMAELLFQTHTVQLHKFLFTVRKQAARNCQYFETSLSKVPKCLCRNVPSYTLASLLHPNTTTPSMHRGPASEGPWNASFTSTINLAVGQVALWKPALGTGPDSHLVAVWS